MGCRTRRPATSLVRLVRTGAGELVVSATSSGRGAWLCPSPDCMQQAIRRRAFDRALRGPISPESLGHLAAAFEDQSGHRP